jgi:hypothetical protein
MGFLIASLDTPACGSWLTARGRSAGIFHLRSAISD